MALVIGDGSGFPKRCFTYTLPDHLKFTFCVTWLEYPAFVWRPNRPDPGPEQLLQIEGVKPSVISDLAIVDTISWLANKLTPEMHDTFAEGISNSLKAIQKRLPAGISISS